MLKTRTFYIRMWGESASFTRYDSPAEGQTYPMLTPAAASGALRALFWHPGTEWEIQSIKVLAPVQIFPMRLKHLSKLSKGNPIDVNEHFTLRLQHVIHQPDYLIAAHLCLSRHNDDAVRLCIKYEEIIERRLLKGQCFEQPYFGQREHLAYFAASSPDLRAWPADADLGPLPAYFDYLPNNKGAMTVKKHVYIPETGEWVPQTFKADFRATYVPGVVRNGELWLDPYLPEF